MTRSKDSEERASSATIEKRPLAHSCKTPAISGHPDRICPDGPYLVDGDRWTCPDCGKSWVARTLWWRRGAPMIWVRPFIWHWASAPVDSGRKDPTP